MNNSQKENACILIFEMKDQELGHSWSFFWVSEMLRSRTCTQVCLRWPLASCHVDHRDHQVLPFLLIVLLALSVSLPGPCIHPYSRCLPTSLHAGAWYWCDTKNKKEMYVDYPQLLDYLEVNMCLDLKKAFGFLPLLYPSLCQAHSDLQFWFFDTWQAAWRKERYITWDWGVEKAWEVGGHRRGSANCVML